MGVLKVKVGTDWVPVSQSFGLPTAGSVGWAQLTADLGWGFVAVADVPGLAVTFNADPTHIYRTTVHMTVSQATADVTLVYAISNGANAILKRIGHFHPLGREQSVNYSLVETGISGSQTRKVQIYSGTANLTTVRGGSAYTPQIIVEDVTPTAALLATPWTAFTPQLYGGSTAATLGTGGNAGRAGRYGKQGTSCHWRQTWVFGTTGAVAPTGPFTFDLPLAAVNTPMFSHIGSGHIISGGVRHNIECLLDQPNKVAMYSAPGGLVTHASPGAATPGDGYYLSGTYEVT